jgi:ComF family protein
MQPNRFLASLADLVLPPICLGCDGTIDPRDTARLICRRCLSRLRRIPNPACNRCDAPRRMTGRSSDEACPECVQWPPVLSGARSACLLLPPADRIIHQFKYRGWPDLARPMGTRMAGIRLPAGARNATVCVPVPTTARRQRERGYNQASLLCAAFARSTDRTVVDALIRHSGRGTQTSLQPVARRANVAGAFSLDTRMTPALRGRTILLIDDVLTTGATAVSCANVLEKADVNGVILMTWARAIDARRLTQIDGASDDHG